MANKKIGGLGEIAFRVNNLDASQAFYEEKIGLELMRRFDDSAFFKIADGYAGHTQILALFDRTAEANSNPNYKAPSQAHTTVDHIAFTIDVADFDSEKVRLEALGLPTRTSIHGWVQWRSLYVNDPDENLVEFVCYDPAIQKD